MLRCKLYQTMKKCKDILVLLRVLMMKLNPKQLKLKQKTIRFRTQSNYLSQILAKQLAIGIGGANGRVVAIAQHMLKTALKSE